MAKIKIKYFIERKRKDGTSRYYWSPNKALQVKGWKLTPLSNNYAEALSQAQQLNHKVDEWRIDQSKQPTQEIPGTIYELVDKYKKSKRFIELSERTKKDYDYFLNIICKIFGDQQAHHITPKIVDKLYEKQAEHSPSRAAYLVRVLSLLFSFGERAEIIPLNSNPARNMKIKRSKSKPELWTKQDIKTFVRIADENDYHSLGTAIQINEWLGQRPADIRDLTINQYRNGQLFITQNKTGAQIALPIDAIKEIKERIEQQIRHNSRKKTTSLHLIQRDDGRPYSEDWFSKSMKKLRDLVLEQTHPDDKDRIKRLIFRSLRHTAVTRLAASGCTSAEISAITGHSLKTCDDIIQIYLIRTSETAKNAFHKRQQKEKQHDV